MLPMAPEPTVSSGQRFRVDGMDCAACARTVEKAVAALDGVRGADVSFGTATMLVDGDDRRRAGRRRAVRRAGYSARPAGQRATDGDVPFWRRTPRALSTSIAVAALLVAVVASLAGAPRAVAEPLYLLSMVAGGWPVARAALTALRRRTLDMNVLMALAAIGAVGIGDYAEGAWVLVLFAVGTTLEALALDRSRRSVEALTELAPEEAQVVVDGVERTVAVAAIAPGSALRVRPGERVPLDGVIVEGASSLDESAADRGVGAGGQGGRATPSSPGRSTRSARSRSARRRRRPTPRSRASRGSSPRRRRAARPASGSSTASRGSTRRSCSSPALLLAVVPVLLGGDLDTWLYRALALLIVACPCALVISVPVAVVSAVGGAARAGVLVKGGEALEALGRIDTVAVDKTGTLTEGTPQLASVEVAPAAEHDARAVARRGGRAAAPSTRSAGRCCAPRTSAGSTSRPPTASSRLPGRGAEATVDGRELWAGGPRLAAERTGALPPEAQTVAERGETPVVLGEGTRVLAVFGLADGPRPEAADAIAAPAPRRRATRGHADRRHRGRRARRRRARRRHGVARRAAPGGEARRGARAAAGRQRGDGRRRRQRRAGARGRRRRHRHGRGRQRRRHRVGRRRAHVRRAASGCPTRSGSGAARCGSSARTSSRRWR